MEQRWTGAGRPVRRLVRGGAGLSGGSDHESGEEQRCEVWRSAVVSTASRTKPAQIPDSALRGDSGYLDIDPSFCLKETIC